jgi:hypothetical protein
MAKQVYTRDPILEQEYPYTVKAFDYQGDSNYKERTQIFDKFINSMPEHVAWYRPDSMLNYTLKSEYNAIMLFEYFRFKTESDRTFFLLRFS